MKKIIFLFLVALLTSCADELPSIENTTWFGLGESEFITVRFYETDCKITTGTSGSKSEMFIYNYNYPTIEINSENRTLTAKINGEQMSLRESRILIANLNKVK